MLMVVNDIWNGARTAIWRAVRRFDARKPLHLVAVGLIVGGVAAPVVSALMTDARYHLDKRAAAVVALPSSVLKSKLVYDKAQHASVFNASGDTDSKDKLQQQIGDGGSKDGKQLYTATLPDKA